MFDYHQKTLENGLRVVFVPMDLTSVVVDLFVDSGAKNEKEDEHGLAHFLEHMAFKGTEKRPDKMTMAKELDKIGAIYNASTSKGYISYWIKNTKEHLELLFDVLSDIVFNPTFPEKEIEVEKGVILEEINMYEDSPREKIYHQFMKLAYGNSSLGREVLGTKKSVSSFTRNDFVNYKKRLYSPENMVLAVAGNAEQQRVFDLAEEWFGKIKSYPVESKTASWQSLENHVLIENRKTEQTHLIFGRPIFGLSDQRRWPMAVLKTVLGTGMSSRLWNEIREKRGLAYYVYAHAGYYRETGLFGVGAGVRNDKTQETVEVIKEELLKVGKTISEEEISDAKEGIHGRLLLSLESTNNLAETVADSWLRENEVRKVEDILERIESVKIDQVRALAEELFRPEELYLAAIGPHRQLKI